MRRLTVIADAEIQQWLADHFVERGATGYTSQPCSGAWRRELESSTAPSNSKVRIEVVMPHQTCESILSFLRQDVLPSHQVTATVETVDVVRRDHFDSTTVPAESEPT